MNDELKEKAKEIYNEMRNECDGSYVGAECEKDVEVGGAIFKIFVCGFWEKGKHFAYSVNGESCGFVYID